MAGGSPSWRPSRCRIVQDKHTQIRGALVLAYFIGFCLLFGVGVRVAFVRSMG